MPTFYRTDQTVQDGLGRAIAGASVAICSQPAVTSTIPPSPLVQLYADSAGLNPIVNPLTTDSLGHAFAYLNQGAYTIVYYSPVTLTTIRTDQLVITPANALSVTYNNDSSNAGTITGVINSTNTVFVLSATPSPSTSLLFSVNGVLQSGFSLSGSTVTLNVAPHTGNQLGAIYQTAN
jgi:hypothetical protein